MELLIANYTGLPPIKVCEEEEEEEGKEGGGER